MGGDLRKNELFQKLGYGGDATRYEQALEEAGLSRPGKQRISLAKQDQVAEALSTRFLRVCQREECRKLAAQQADRRAIALAASPTDCEMCGGSVNALAVAEMVRACEAVGWRRLCVVGGSPSTTAELTALVGASIQVRLVPGTASRTKRAAEADLAWADRVVIWGSTELAHKVSGLYKGPHVITAARRSVAELARAVAESAARMR